MVRIDCLVLGYRRLNIERDKLDLATSILLRSSINATILPCGEIIVRESDYYKIINIFSGRVEFYGTDILGLYGLLKKIPNKIAISFALSICVLLIFLCSSVVWDIRVDGNDTLPSSSIILALSDCGFEIGSSWDKCDLSAIENEMQLRFNDSISWINLNKRGFVCYVSVIEKATEKPSTDSQTFEYANIVSDSDCVIEEVTVSAGLAAVKPGDTVKKGDVLIFGILPDEQGGGFCRAQGRVTGRISDQVTVEVDRNESICLLKSKKIYSIDIIFLNFSINIFKLYGNLTNKYDIIDCEKSYSLFERCKLPFKIQISYLPVYESLNVSYTDEELVRIASERLSSLCISRLALCDLLRLRSSGEFTEQGYRMVNDMVFCRSVGEFKEFYAQ